MPTRLPTAFAVFALALAVGRAEEPKKELVLPAFTTPKGWTELEPTVTDKQLGLTAKRLRAGTDDGAPTVSVSVLRGDGGGLVNNVNRWRSQVQLKPLDDKDALTSLAPIKIDGTDGHLLDVAVPADAKVGGKNPVERLVVAIVSRDGQTVYVRMAGTAAAVGEQKKAFDEFVKSIRLPK